MPCVNAAPDYHSDLKRAFEHYKNFIGGALFEDLTVSETILLLDVIGSHIVADQLKYTSESNGG